ncbi:MAG: YceI family protein [Rubrivivax sp.]|nr:YceI family protein [Rubrivivax sp.]
MWPAPWPSRAHARHHRARDAGRGQRRPGHGQRQLHAQAHRLRPGRRRVGRPVGGGRRGAGALQAAAGRGAVKAAGLALVAGLVAGAAAAAPVDYLFTPTHSFVHFEVLHFGASTLRGRFGPVPGELTLDPAAGRGRLALTIDLRTLDTGFRLLDARLRQPDLLDIGNQPQAWFVAERVGCVDGPPRRCGGDFTGELRRSAFGADFGLPLVADRVVLKVQVEALPTRQ